MPWPIQKGSNSGRKPRKYKTPLSINCFPSPRTQKPHSNTKKLCPWITDGGTGVGVNNHDVKFRLAEIVLIPNLDYLIRHHLANNDSGDNEDERTQWEWEYKAEFDDLMEHVELTSRKDDAPMLNGFMKSKTSLPKSEVFLITKSIWKKAKKILIPSYHCFSMLQNFINKNLEVEEKYLTFLWSACVDTCE